MRLMLPDFPPLCYIIYYMAINKILRYICICCLFLLPFITLIVTTSLFFPYITGKNFVFRVLVEIMFVCSAALAFRDKAYRPRWRSPIVISLAAFMVIVFLADLFGEYFYKSFWSNFERMEGFITFLHLWAYFFVATIILNTRKLWDRFFQLSFAISIILGFIGLYQHFHAGIDRIDATLGNSTYLGALMLFNIFLLLIFIMRSIKAKTQNWGYVSTVYVLIALFDLYILFLTGTRGAFLGVLGGLVVMSAILGFRQRENKYIKIAGIGVISLVVILAIFFVSFRNSPIIKNHGSIARFAGPVNAVLTGDYNSFLATEGRGRLLIWQAAFKGFSERPILGWGQENFNYIFNKYYTPRCIRKSSGSIEVTMSF